MKTKSLTGKLREIFNMKTKIKNALISVSDKSNLLPILKILKKFKINILSSGGTYKVIRKLGFKCNAISSRVFSFSTALVKTFTTSSYVFCAENPLS